MTYRLNHQKIVIEANAFVPVGQLALSRNGRIVWTGNLGSPIDDVDFDKAYVSPFDFTALAMRSEPTVILKL